MGVDRYFRDSHPDTFSNSEPGRIGQPDRDRFRLCHQQFDTVGDIHPVANIDSDSYT